MKDKKERRRKLAVNTKEEFIEGLRRQKPKVYIAGERVENLVDHPLFRTGIESAAIISLEKK
jgi:aromatic ring hydroxylase